MPSGHKPFGCIARLNVLVACVGMVSSTSVVYSNRIVLRMQFSKPSQISMRTALRFTIRLQLRFCQQLSRYTSTRLVYVVVVVAVVVVDSVDVVIVAVVAVVAFKLLMH
jgi:hypothetical protein